MSIENPLSFFRDLTENYGIKRLFKEFLQSINEPNYPYDKLTESFTIYEVINEDGEIGEHIYSFDNYVDEKVKEEYRNAKLNIEKYILGLPYIEQKGKAKTLIALLNQYRTAFHKSSHVTRFEVIATALNKLIDDINEKYLTTDKNEQSAIPFNVNKGMKTDLVKLLNSLYDLNLIRNNDNEPITKKEFMEYFGLSDYTQTLSQSFKANKDKFLEIFDKLRENASLTYDETQEKSIKQKK